MTIISLLNFTLTHVPGFLIAFLHKFANSIHTVKEFSWLFNNFQYHPPVRWNTNGYQGIHQLEIWRFWKFLARIYYISITFDPSSKILEARLWYLADFKGLNPYIRVKWNPWNICITSWFLWNQDELPYILSEAFLGFVFIVWEESYLVLRVQVHIRPWSGNKSQPKTDIPYWLETLPNEACQNKCLFWYCSSRSHQI